jgi:HlyD family secretion protein
VEAAKTSISASQFNINSAEASMKESKENLNKTNIYAPVDATISKLSKEKGERVVGTNMMEGTEIMRLANLNEMEVSVDVSENDIVRVSKGDTADIEIDAYLNRKFKGIVTEVANSANVTGAISTDQVTNFSVKVRIIRDSYNDLLEGKSKDFSPFRPGMSATVDIQTKKVTNVIALPIQAVTTRDTTKRANKKVVVTKANEEKVATKETPLKECVFIVENGKATMRVVKTGIQDNAYIQIVNGIKAGETVITAPYNLIAKTLLDGNTVKIVKKEELFDKEKK